MKWLTSMAVVAAVFAVANTAQAAIANPENFDSYSLGQNLEPFDGWSRNDAGSQVLGTADHEIVGSSAESVGILG